LRLFNRIWLNRRDYLTKAGNIDGIRRYLDKIVLRDLERKLVVLTGLREVGKATLSPQLLAQEPHEQYLNFDPTAAERPPVQCKCGLCADAFVGVWWFSRGCLSTKFGA
jgi:hypothetical protein